MSHSNGIIKAPVAMSDVQVVIVTARKVVDHEKRIAELERENQRLKEMLNVA